MKRLLVLTLVVGLVFSFSAVTFAQEEGATEEEVEEINGAHGILPTNPFYFFKEFGRGVRRFFAFGAERRAEFELEVIREKAEELEVVEALDPGNQEAITKAIDNYNESVDRLREHLEFLENNPNVEYLIEKLEERARRHNELFDGLLERHEELQERVEDARNKFMEAEAFTERIRNRVEEGEEAGGEQEREREEEREQEGAGPNGETACTLDAKLCPDGSWVGRVAPDCEFAPCSGGGSGNGRGEPSSGNGQGSPGGDNCIDVYEPVCGEDGKTYSNSCRAGLAGAEIEYEGVCGSDQ